MRLPSPRWFVLVALVALALRALVWWQHQGSPFSGYLNGDEYHYWTWAGKIAGGAWLPDRVFYTGPLFPYLLALLFKLSPRLDQASLSGAHLVLNWATCLMLVPLLRPGLGEKVALTASAMALFFAPGVFFALRLMPTTLGVFLLVAGFLALPFNGGRPLRRCLLSGILLGLAVLTVPSSLLTIGVAVLLLLVRLPARRRMLPAAVLALSALLTIIPATVSNYLQDGSLVLVSSSFGTVFYTGNNPRAEGTWSSVEGLSTAVGEEMGEVARIASREAGRPLNAQEVSQHFFKKGLRFIAENPGSWALLELRKAILLASGMDVPLEASLSRERRDFLGVLWCFPIGGTVTLALAVLALTGADSRKGLLLPVLAACALGAPCLVFLVGNRYAFPFLFFLLAAAAAGANGLPRLAQRPWRALACLPVVVAAVLASGFLRDPWWEANDYLPKLAMAYEEAGDARMVRETFERMLQASPDSPFVHCLMGDVHRRQGAAEEALRAYDRSLELDGKQRDCRFSRAALLWEMGTADEALADLSLLLEDNPGDDEVRAVRDALAAGQAWPASRPSHGGPARESAGVDGPDRREGRR